MAQGEARTELEPQAGTVIEILNIAGFSNQSVEEATYKKDAGISEETAAGSGEVDVQ